MLKDQLRLTAETTDSMSERAERSTAIVASWVSSEPMRQLLSLFGEELPEGDGESDGGLGWVDASESLPGWLRDVAGNRDAQVPGLAPAHLAALRGTLATERIAAAHFDFRGRGATGYRERIQAASADFGDELRARVFELCEHLGLVHADRPRYPNYDKTLVLGGGHRSPQLRARYAAEIASDGVELGDLYFLGSPRFLITDPPEAPQVAYYAPDATDEFDLLTAAAQREFGLTPAPATFICGCDTAEAVCPRWPAIHHDSAPETPPQYTHERLLELRDSDERARASVLSASTGRPPFRPDTSDTYRLWSKVAAPQPGQRALIVTTQVFVPFQAFDGIRRLYLGHGLDIDVVGFGGEWGDRPLTTEFLLQEVLSSVRSARRLLVAAAENQLASTAEEARTEPALD